MSNTDHTPEQSQDIIADYTGELEQIQMEGNQLAVKKARNALYIAAGLIFLSEMIGMARLGGFDSFVFIFALVEAGIFVALALWAKKKPYTAVVTGLIVFVAIIAFSVFINGKVYGAEGVFKALVGGIIFKVIILVGLIRPLKDAKELQAYLDRKAQN